MKKLISSDPWLLLLCVLIIVNYMIQNNHKLWRYLVQIAKQPVFLWSWELVHNTSNVSYSFDI